MSIAVLKPMVMLVRTLIVICYRKLEQTYGWQLAVLEITALLSGQPGPPEAPCYSWVMLLLAERCGQKEALSQSLTLS